MKKKLIIISLLIMTTLFSACGGDNHTKSSEPVKLDASEYADLSEDMYSFEIKLDGKKYTLPADFSQFKNNGWTMKDEDLKDSKRYVYYNPKYNNDYMSSYWINVDTKTNMITSIRVANFYN